MKKLSDWQLNRLRDCLRAYHAYGTGNDHGVYNWVDVQEAISISTQTKIPSERLRQFVLGFKDSNGVRKFPVPKNIEAVWRFVTDEDLQLITEAELTEFKPSFQAGMRLLEYLDQAFDTERITPPAKMQGVYRSRIVGEEDVLLTELVLEQPTSDGLITVTKTDEYFDLEYSGLITNWSPADRMAGRNSRIKFSGWAILTPEDNLMFFLKNERNGTNLYYLTMASDFSHAEGVPVTQLVLLHHDYPLEPDYVGAKDVRILDSVMKQVESRIAVFGRIG